MSFRNLMRWLACALLLAAASSHAQVPAYTGEDRMQRLLEGARREGTLTVYTSMAEKDHARLVAAFEKKYGLKVNVWRSGKHKVLQRVVAEGRGGRHEVDVVLNPSPEMEALHREKLLQPVRSPVQKDLITAALPAHGEWTGMRVYLFVQAYNTNKVRREELPRSWQDLLDPRWKGRLGIEAKDQEWFYTLLQAVGEEQGQRLFRTLASGNGLAVHSGHSLLNNLVVSGEVPLALTMYSYLPAQAKAAGAPVDYIALAPVIAYTDGVGIARHAPHPHAATLFYDFLLTEGQAIVAQHHAITTHRRDEPTVAAFKPVYIEPAKVLDNYDRWTRLYEEAVHGRGAAAGGAR